MADSSAGHPKRVAVLAKAKFIRRIWISATICFFLGCVFLALYPLLHTGSPRVFIVVVGLQFCLMPILIVAIFGRKWGLWARDKVPDSKSQNSSDTDADRDIRWTYATILMFATLGLLAICLFAFAMASPFTWKQFSKIIGLGLLYAGAFFGSGSLIGFLFGIPRSLHPKDPSSSSNQNAQAIFATNTNLEEISDWLTKIIVGLGLINLKGIPKILKSVAWYFANFCGGDYCEAVIAGLIIYFSICGFFLGYLMTRLYLTGAFTRAEGSGTVDTLTISKETVDTVGIPVEDIGKSGK